MSYIQARDITLCMQIPVFGAFARLVGYIHICMYVLYNIYSMYYIGRRAKAKMVSVIYRNGADVEHDYANNRNA